MDMRKRLWQYAGIYTGFLGVVFLSYKGYQRYRDPPAYRMQRTSLVQKVAGEKPVFAGVTRRSEAEEVYRKLEKAIVVLYHPLAAGKTQLVAYIKATSDRPCLVVKGMDTLEATLQQFGFAVSPGDP